MGGAQAAILFLAKEKIYQATVKVRASGVGGGEGLTRCAGFGDGGQSSVDWGIMGRKKDTSDHCAVGGLSSAAGIVGSYCSRSPRTLLEAIEAGRPSELRPATLLSRSLLARVLSHFLSTNPSMPSTYRRRTEKPASLGHDSPFRRPRYQPRRPALLPLRSLPPPVPSLTLRLRIRLRDPLPEVSEVQRGTRVRRGYGRLRTGVSMPAGGVAKGEGLLLEGPPPHYALIHLLSCPWRR